MSGTHNPFSAGGITSQFEYRPSRVILFAPEKWGKTSWAAQFPGAIFLMTKGEDGLLALMQSGQLPPIPHFPQPAETWNDVKLAISALTVEAHPHRLLVVDTLNGAERLASEWLCRNHFEGDWTRYTAYASGDRQLARDGECWPLLLEMLDNLRLSRRMSIILLVHRNTRTHKNPTGADYDAYEPALSKEVWSITHKWGDAILRGDFEMQVRQEKGKGKGKASGGEQRVLHCAPSAAGSGGNRLGLPALIRCGDSPQEAYRRFKKALGQARQAATATAAATPPAQPAASPVQPVVAGEATEAWPPPEEAPVAPEEQE